MKYIKWTKKPGIYGIVKPKGIGYMILWTDGDVGHISSFEDSSDFIKEATEEEYALALVMES